MVQYPVASVIQPLRRRRYRAKPARVGEFAVLRYDGSTSCPLAIFLLDPYLDRLYLRHCMEIPVLNVKDIEVVRCWLEELVTESATASGSTLLRTLEDRLSNTLQITDPSPVLFTDIDSTLTELYFRHIAKG